MQGGQGCSKPLILRIKNIELVFFMTIFMILMIMVMVLMILTKALVYRHCGVIGQKRVGGV